MAALNIDSSRLIRQSGQIHLVTIRIFHLLGRSLQQHSTNITNCLSRI